MSEISSDELMRHLIQRDLRLNKNNKKPNLFGPVTLYVIDVLRGVRASFD